MALVPRRTLCGCGKKARKGQRTCRECHAAKMKAYRQQQAQSSAYAYVDMRHFLDLKHGFVKGIVVSNEPGSKQTLVRITVCKNHKKQ